MREKKDDDEDEDDNSWAQWCVPVKLQLVGKISKRHETGIALGQPTA